MTLHPRLLAALCLCLAALFLPRTSHAQSVVAYHEATDAQHQTQWNNLRPQGYRIISLSVYGDPANERYAAVWIKRAGPLQAAIHNTNAAGYQSFFNTVTQDGYRPVIVTATGPPATATFAAVFEKSSVPGWFAAHDLVDGADTSSNTVQYQHKWARLNNYIPISLSRYGNAGSDTRYAGVWVYNSGNTPWNHSEGPFASNYQDDFSAFAAMDYRPRCIGVNNGQRYSAVFSDDRIGGYIAHHDMTSQDYDDKVDLYAASGYYPILVEGAGIGSAARFAAIFAKQDIPSARVWKITGPTPSLINSTDTAKFDNAIKSWMQLHGVRAGQFTFMRNGRTAYARAFTWAESTYPVTQPSSPMRLASNSKAFAAAAIEKLRTTTHPDILSKKAFATLGITSKALDSQTKDSRVDDITVQNLVDHKGGWDVEWTGNDPVFHCRDISIELGITNAPLSTWNFARWIYGEPLQHTPGTYEAYSNIGYILMGLIVEKLSGKTFEDYVQQNVLAPAGITQIWQARTDKSLRLAGEGFYHDPSIGLSSLDPDASGKLPGIYGGGGFLNEMMSGGGGMAATATAMTQFAHNFAIWGMGGRRPNFAREGSMPGSSSWAESRTDGADWAMIFNTRWWKSGYAEPVQDIRLDLSAVMKDIKPRVVSLSASPAKPAGGQTSLAIVTLGWEAPPGGAVVTMSSSNTSAATVPATVTVPEGSTYAVFNITTYPQTANTTTNIKATYNGATKTLAMTVTPITMLGLSVAPTSVYGGAGVTGTITVYGKAAVDTTITVSSANSAAHPVGPVVIPAGASSTTFQITTDPVSTSVAGAITASVSGTSKSATLTVKAPLLSSVKLTPNPVAGGNLVNGEVFMTGPVAEDTVIQLTNANTKALFANATNSMSLTIPAGSSKGAFQMRTAATAAQVKGNVTAVLGRTSKYVTLTVNP